jgi:hypothetical protein
MLEARNSPRQLLVFDPIEHTLDTGTDSTEFSWIVIINDLSFIDKLRIKAGSR